MRLPALLLALFVASACDCGEKQAEVRRCDVDLEASGLFDYSGAGAHAFVAKGAEDLLTGSSATGQAGDLVLENDHIKVVVQRPIRLVGPTPYGGGIIDAARKGGGDEFGRMSLLYTF